jgi:hypothetical protein
MDVCVKSKQLFHTAAGDIRTAIDAAVRDACYTASYRLSHSLMLVLVERALQLQPLKQQTIAQLLARVATTAQQTSRHDTLADAAGLTPTVQHQEDVRQLQLTLLQEAEAAGVAAQQVFAAQKRLLLLQAGGSREEQQAVQGMQNAAITEIQGLLVKLPEIRQQLHGHLDAEEVASVLAALMQVRTLAICYFQPLSFRCQGVGFGCQGPQSL